MESVPASHSDFIVRLSNFIPLAEKLIYIIRNFEDRKSYAQTPNMDRDMSENALNLIAKRFTTAIERSMQSLSIEGAVDNA